MTLPVAIEQASKIAGPAVGHINLMLARRMLNRARIIEVVERLRAAADRIEEACYDHPLFTDQPETATGCTDG